MLWLVGDSRNSQNNFLISTKTSADTWNRCTCPVSTSVRPAWNPETNVRQIDQFALDAGSSCLPRRLDTSICHQIQRSDCTTSYGGELRCDGPCGKSWLVTLLWKVWRPSSSSTSVGERSDHSGRSAEGGVATGSVGLWRAGTWLGRCRTSSRLVCQNYGRQREP